MFEGVICSTLPNFIKIGQTVAAIWRFNIHNGGRQFVKFTFLTVGSVKGPFLHHHTKFDEDRSNRCRC